MVVSSKDKDKDNKENRERSEERLSGAKQDLFELLERVQCSRIEDQRCVLPSKLSQVRARCRGRACCGASIIGQVPSTQGTMGCTEIVRSLPLKTLIKDLLQ